MVIANDDMLYVHIYFFGHRKPCKAVSEEKIENAQPNVLYASVKFE